MKIDGDRLIMDEGSEYSANGGVIGLGPDLSISEGWDDGFSDMPEHHRREIAAYMVAQWTRVLNGEPEQD